MDSVEKIYDIVGKETKDFCLMHCVSSYPTPEHDLNLNVIKSYREKFDVVIG